ncbi:MAG: hypothetical protein FJZ09_04980 [Candidatus Omnitrophica bacterium]|nr:hypothetical protein [Candidatus Omnitrophota bacterium]
MNREEIFGRKEYVDTLIKRARGLKDGYRQNLAIIGDEMAGKTSLIFDFLEKFHDNNYLMLYLEARPESPQEFSRRFIAILLYNFLINSSQELKEDLDFLIRKSEKYIPRTVQKIRLILQAAKRMKKHNIFSQLLLLCDSINSETGKFCVVIIDEFQNLEGLGISGLYREWSKLLVTQKNTMYVIVSSQKFRAKNILSKHLCLLFGNFEVVNVEPFGIRMSEEYLDRQLYGLTLEPAEKSFLVHFTGGNPFYLKVICEELHREKGDLAEILERLLFDASGMLNQRFSNFIRQFSGAKGSGEYTSILYLIASGRNKLKELSSILKKTGKELTPGINRLLESDVLTRSGDFLKINDRVLGFWLRFVYQGKLFSLTFDARHQKAAFRGKIDSLMQEFYLSANKSIPQRITELLRLFEDETVQIEKKRVRLSHFREIKPLEFSNRAIKEGLICRSRESLWIMAFKPGMLTETDITEFSRECKKYRHKLQRKIIVTLGDVDANTRLRAMEERIWTWDVNSLNQMLDLYSKPWVIA